MIICIPSYKRCGDVITLDQIPDSLMRSVYMFVRGEEL